MRTRIRTLKPEMWADEAVGALSRHARLLLVGLITMADDEGRFRARRSGILGHVFPADDDALECIDGWIGEIKQQRIVAFYVVDGTPYGAFRNWKRHQRVPRPTPSELPAPPDRKVSRENAIEPHDSSGNFKKSAIPDRVRRAVAKDAGAVAGEETDARCHWCGKDGLIVWARLADGRPGSWVTFIGLELDHVVPESEGGVTEESNIVLACRSCNRRRGNRHGSSHPDVRDSVSTDHGSLPAQASVPIRSDPVQVFRLCQKLARHIKQNDLKADPKPESERWLTDMRLLVQDRGGDVAEVERIIDWCQADSFWRSNILSPTKLRAQFTQLVLKAGGNVVEMPQRSDALNRMDDFKRFYPSEAS